jgi:hypothetical protein
MIRLPWQVSYLERGDSQLVILLDVNAFPVELKDGDIKNVGPADNAASAKLFDVETITLREFGDQQAKIVAEDDDGNEIQIAVDPDQVESLREGVTSFSETH